MDQAYRVAYLAVVHAGRFYSDRFGMEVNAVPQAYS